MILLISSVYMCCNGPGLFSRVGPPPIPAGFTTEIYSVNNSPDSKVNINFIWDMDFSTRHAIESYNISSATTFSAVVSCRMSCPLYRPCVCVSNGQLPKEGVNITISAVNCDNQEGPNTTITVWPQGRL